MEAVFGRSLLNLVISTFKQSGGVATLQSDYSVIVFQENYDRMKVLVDELKSRAEKIKLGKWEHIDITHCAKHASIILCLETPVIRIHLLMM